VSQIGNELRPCAIGASERVERAQAVLCAFGKLPHELGFESSFARLATLSELPGARHECDSGGNQRYSGDVAEQFTARNGFLGQNKEGDYGHPLQIHDACHEE